MGNNNNNNNIIIIIIIIIILQNSTLFWRDRLSSLMIMLTSILSMKLS